ncbi:hypothetical protein CSAL01_05903 [Colletotrichum salicis]|uniref:2EXR domain-containing protein n=1 Tax=Colletotrichum salicis TaxID=1209931 RepID=A0A135UBI3_9PEZI|nr:hypothetical protein CSAL01_05903 [Colletotrichum salicis]
MLDSSPLTLNFNQTRARPRSDPSNFQSHTSIPNPRDRYKPTKIDEPAELVKSLTDSLEAIKKVQSQQSKTFSELAKLCVTKEAPAEEVARVEDLQETQETLASIMSLQIKIMKRQAAMVLSRQQATAMPSKQQKLEPPSVTATVFPNFRRLPAEIRKLIWIMALPYRRVLEAPVAGYHDIYKRFRPPVIRAVCKEAWEVTEENGLFAMGSESTGVGGTWFNPQKDVVILEENFSLGSLAECYPEIIAIDRMFIEDFKDLKRILLGVVDFLFCRKVIILFRTADNFKYKDGAAPKLFNLQPHELIWSPYTDDRPSMPDKHFDYTWEALKKTMKSCWEDEFQKNEMVRFMLEGRDMPVI